MVLNMKWKGLIYLKIEKAGSATVWKGDEMKNEENKCE